jgi:hypothetical protein
MITAQIATIPDRMETLPKVIGSLLPQVDLLNVMLNSYSDSQAAVLFNRYFYDDRINFFRRNNEKGDAEKFYGCDNITGYVLTCDDDLIYPDDYVANMIFDINHYNSNAIISYHGRKFKPGIIDSYYSGRNREAAYRCLDTVTGYHQVDSGGTGVMGWDADKVRISYDWFKEPNMADVWVAVNAKKNNIPIYVAPHPEGWFGIAYEGKGIWDDWNEGRKNDQIQTKAWNDAIRSI